MNEEYLIPIDKKTYNALKKKYFLKRVKNDGDKYWIYGGFINEGITIPYSANNLDNNTDYRNKVADLLHTLVVDSWLYVDPSYLKLLTFFKIDNGKIDYVALEEVDDPKNPGKKKKMYDTSDITQFNEEERQKICYYIEKNIMSANFVYIAIERFLERARRKAQIKASKQSKAEGRGGRDRDSRSDRDEKEKKQVKEYRWCDVYSNLAIFKTAIKREIERAIKTIIKGILE